MVTDANARVGGSFETKDAQVLAANLNKLLAMHRPPLSNQAAARAVTEKTGVSVSTTYMWHLRRGTVRNPGLRHLRAIAETFGVRPSDLIDCECISTTDAQIDSALRDSRIKGLVLATHGLSPLALDLVIEASKLARYLDGLSPTASHDEPDVG